MVIVFFGIFAMKSLHNPINYCIPILTLQCSGYVKMWYSGSIQMYVYSFWPRRLLFLIKATFSSNIVVHFQRRSLCLQDALKPLDCQYTKFVAFAVSVRTSVYHAEHRKKYFFSTPFTGLQQQKKLEDNKLWLQFVCCIQQSDCTQKRVIRQ